MFISFLCVYVCMCACVYLCIKLTSEKSTLTCRTEWNGVCMYVCVCVSMYKAYLRKKYFDESQ